VQQVRGLLREYPVSLASGNTPEPLSQFLAAYLQQRLPDRRVQIRTGLFGDYYQAPGDGMGRKVSSSRKPVAKQVAAA